MIDTIIAGIQKLVAINPFSVATWFVITVICFVVWLFARASKDPNSPVDWEDLIIDTTTYRVSPYKLGYLIGVIVSTWIVITLTNNTKLNYDIMAVYLMFLLGGAGISAYGRKKNSGYSDSIDDYSSPDQGYGYRRPISRKAINNTPSSMSGKVNEEDMDDALPPKNN